MRIKRSLFPIEPNGAHERLVHVESSEPLPTWYRFGHLLIDLDPPFPSDESLYFHHHRDFELVGLRSPQSAFVTLKGLNLSGNEGKQRRQEEDAQRPVDAQGAYR